MAGQSACETRASVIADVRKVEMSNPNMKSPMSASQPEMKNPNTTPMGRVRP